jgi:hypothetical protein
MCAIFWHDFYDVFVISVTYFDIFVFLVPSNFRSSEWSLSVMLSSKTAAVRVFQTRPSASLPWRPEIFICFLCVCVETVQQLADHAANISLLQAQLQIAADIPLGML